MRATERHTSPRDSSAALACPERCLCRHLHQQHEERCICGHLRSQHDESGCCGLVLGADLGDGPVREVPARGMRPAFVTGSDYELLDCPCPEFRAFAPVLERSGSEERSENGSGERGGR